jgi:hypothetical protein
MLKPSMHRMRMNGRNVYPTTQGGFNEKELLEKIVEILSK